MLDLSSDIACYALIAAILGLLVARTRRGRELTNLGNHLPEIFKKPLGRQKDLAVLAFKKCPQCAEQLPLSALVCDACGHNFLASSILRHKLLPAPQESLRAAGRRSPA